MCKINRGIQIINDCESMINMISKKIPKSSMNGRVIKNCKIFF